MPGYADDLAAIHAAGFTAIARAAAAELLPRLPPAARVVELGCGDGTTAAMLARAGHRVHGIDLSPALVERARRSDPTGTFVLGSFLDAPLPREQDAVLAVGEVLAYRLDPRHDRDALPHVLRRCALALRAGGMLLLDLPAPQRAGDSDQRSWTEGDGWAVLVASRAAGGVLTVRSSRSARETTAATAGPPRRTSCCCTSPPMCWASCGRRAFAGSCCPLGTPAWRCHAG